MSTRYPVISRLKKDWPAFELSRPPSLSIGTLLKEVGRYGVVSRARAGQKWCPFGGDGYTPLSSSPGGALRGENTSSEPFHLSLGGRKSWLPCRLSNLSCLSVCPSLHPRTSPSIQNSPPPAVCKTRHSSVPILPFPSPPPFIRTSLPILRPDTHISRQSRATSPFPAGLFSALTPHPKVLTLAPPPSSIPLGPSPLRTSNLETQLAFFRDETTHLVHVERRLQLGCTGDHNRLNPILVGASTPEALLPHFATSNLATLHTLV